MKRIILFFAVCLGLSVFQTDVSYGADAQKNAPRRDITNPVSVSRTGNSSTTKNDTKKSVSNRASITQATVVPRSQQNQTKTRDTTTHKTLTNRTAKTPTIKKTTNRTVATSRAAAISPAIKNTKKIRDKQTNKSATRVSRVATLDNEKIANIKSKNYSKCKTVYYECMDEFCANKDANLRRCACSSRIHEFDNIKKQLSAAEDKMLDFNQRLLTVSMDKEDALAINNLTEGEDAFNTKDTSESEKLLQKIMKSLNASNDSKLNNQLSAISLSLDVENAWDSVDSLSGVSTTSKSGVDLYNAARPICVEMAEEVCSKDELEIAQNSYTLTIQQDCETVAKSYDTQYNKTIEKIHESSALLDMSRLNTYQQRNSDDVLTCKAKILDQLSNSAVCGTDLYKCLDTTGKYIDPSTGEAFLSADLYDITTLLTTPTGEETWSKMPQNEKFVTFLNSKKAFLTPATEQCRDLADTVWKEFLNDALAKIKLAQNAKLETIRQSCTTLVTECKIGKQKSLSDFDSRALSTFSILTDTTVNAMCQDVQSACTTLMGASGDGDVQWQSGMTQIAADTSYEKVKEQCTTIGQDCIIKQCTGTAGNFALCNKYSDSPRRAILKRNACWKDVLECVNQATNINDMNIPNTTSALCNVNDKACIITEQIWGGCEYNYGIKNANGVDISATYAISTSVNSKNDESQLIPSNKILVPSDESSSTLLSWLATNTGTKDAIDSCSTYNCPVGYYYNAEHKKCFQIIDADKRSDQIVHITENLTNTCAGGQSAKDMYGNCCISGIAKNGICVRNQADDAYLIQEATCITGEGSSDIKANYYCPVNVNSMRISQDKKVLLYCIGSKTTTDNNSVITCNGLWVLVDQYGRYFNPNIEFDPNSRYMTYVKDGQVCEYYYTEQEQTYFWTKTDNTVCSGVAIDNNSRFIIKLDGENVNSSNSTAGNQSANQNNHNYTQVTLSGENVNSSSSTTGNPSANQSNHNYTQVTIP